jgi:hypothetical protein
MSSPYYDNDENNIRRWKEWTQATGGFEGMMYTTWANRYDHLAHFAEYAWNHAPYIYHYPPLPEADPSGDFGISLYVIGDKWDAAWQLDNVQLLYRTNPSMRFTAVELDKSAGAQEHILRLADANKWLQYYIMATDNKGWTSRLPYGANRYFEVGTSPNSVEETSDTQFTLLGIYPNPGEGNENAYIKWVGPRQIELEIIGLSGVTYSAETLSATIVAEPANTAAIDISSLPPGVFFVRASSGIDIRTVVFVRY